MHRSRHGDLWAIAAIGLSAGLAAVAFALLVSNSLVYALGVPVLVLGALAILRDWRIGVVLAAGTLPLAGLAAPGVSASVFRVIAAVTVVSVGVRLTSDGALRDRLSALVRCRLMVILGVYLGWIALSLLWAPRADLWATQLIASAGFVLLAALVALADRRTIGWIWTALLVSSLVAIPLAPLFGRSAEFITGFGRLSIGGGGPNEKATLLAVAIGVAIARKHARGSSRLLTAVAVLSLGAAIVLTGSRSGTAALIVVVAGWVLITFFNRNDESADPRSVRVGRSIAIWAVAAVLFVLVALLVTDRVDTGLDLEELGTTGSARVATLAHLDSGVDLSGREEIWPVMFASVREHPVLGVGAGNAEVASLDAGVYRGSDVTRGAGPHNTLLQTLVEGGLVGATLYLAVWLTAAAYLVALWRRGEPLAGPLALGVLAWAVAGLVLQLQDQKVAALLLGSIVALWLASSVSMADEVHVE
jgi:O-antigen ligase